MPPINIHVDYLTPNGINDAIMKKPIYPTYINLRELNPEGESFIYNRDSGELNQCLKDLIQTHPYNVELHLRPMGNAFEITGKILTKMSLLCSRCGRDMDTPIEDQFQELILVMDERPRAGHSGHTGSHEDGPFCNYVTSYQMSLADFVREHIAAAEPFTPHCDRSDCEDYFRNLQATVEPAGFSGKNPFEVLKNLPIKNQSS